MDGDEKMATMLLQRILLEMKVFFLGIVERQLW